jgi:UDP-N-acetylglucosamine--N-acetylmuramyl-(pentapeptide) pyrophosphoryl-undecaprenol N-acetylglucosamine transferase
MNHRMEGKEVKRLLLSGGGTGGHIYPALAIAKAVRKRYPDCRIAYIGTKNGLESKIVPKEEKMHFYTIDIQGFQRKLAWENVRTVIKFMHAVKQSKRYIQAFQPDVVVGTGGYVSGPPVYAAYRLGVPTLIHEQNVLPGLTTKFLARFAQVVALSFEQSQPYLRKAQRVILTGNPRATEVSQAHAAAGRKSLHLADATRPIVLFVGGSGGAKTINEAVLQMVPSMKKMTHVQFIYVTGEAYYEAVCAQIKLEEVPQLAVYPFIYNMPDVLAAAYLVVGRAGASTLAELTALGLPSILIPSPYVTNNHQEANARSLEEQGATKMLLEQQCTAENLWKEVKYLLENRKEHEAMRAAARKLGRPQAAHMLVEELEKLVLARG